MTGSPLVVEAFRANGVAVGVQALVVPAEMQDRKGTRSGLVSRDQPQKVHVEMSRGGSRCTMRRHDAVDVDYFALEASRTASGFSGGEGSVSPAGTG